MQCNFYLRVHGGLSCSSPSLSCWFRSQCFSRYPTLIVGYWHTRHRRVITPSIESTHCSYFPHICSLLHITLLPDLIESLAAMKKLRRTQDTHDVNREFNDIYRALTSDAKLGDGWVDLLASKSICLRLVSSYMGPLSHHRGSHK